jgi:hypothetical protein
LGAITVVASIALVGCASVPAESVTLSSTLGNDLLALKKSHLVYVNGFYDRVEAETNRVIDQEYAPMLIRAALKGASGKLLLEKLNEGKASDQGAQDAIAYTQRFLEDVKKFVDSERSATISAIESSRTEALSNTNAAYSQVMQGNAVLTAYLTSLVKVRDAQNELLKDIGVPNLQDDLAKELATASDSINQLNSKGAAGLSSLDDLQKGLEQLRNATKIKAATAK